MSAAGLGRNRCVEKSCDTWRGNQNRLQCEDVGAPGLPRFWAQFQVWHVSKHKKMRALPCVDDTWRPRDLTWRSQHLGERRDGTGEVSGTGGTSRQGETGSRQGWARTWLEWFRITFLCFFFQWCIVHALWPKGVGRLWKVLTRVWLKSRIFAPPGRIQDGQRSVIRRCAAANSSELGEEGSHGDY